MDQRLHDGRTMRRPLWFWIGLVGSCWLPALAYAQSSSTPSGTSTPTGISSTGGVGVQLKLVGDQSYTAQAQRGTPLGKAQCDKKVDLTFVLTGLALGPKSAKYVEIYRGTNCNTMESKDGVGNDDCVRISFISRNQSSTFEMPVIPIEDVCSSMGDVTLWFLPVDTLGTNATLSFFGKYELPLDTIPPNAPANVRGGSGETQIQINWTRSDNNISRNLIVWDAKPVTVTDTTTTDAPVVGDGGAAGGSAAGSGAAGSSAAGATDEADGGAIVIPEPECTSSLLTPGQALDVNKLPKGLGHKEAVGNVESFTLSGSEINSARAAVAILAQDLAGNWSVLSNVTCVNVVDTTGFWDEYKVNGGDAEAGCACSLPGSRAAGTRHAASGLLAALALLGIAVVRARRKRLT
jgi:hypothetical protein